MRRIHRIGRDCWAAPRTHRARRRGPDGSEAPGLLAAHGPDLVDEPA
ncbi:hypothetical protein ACFCZQ_04915 [Streptomyces virginiae]|nr:MULTISPECIES: hypothetical protein [unclassified Streptomyces]